MRGENNKKDIEGNGDLTREQIRIRFKALTNKNLKGYVLFRHGPGPDDIFISLNPAMRKAYDLIQKIALADISTVFLGATGVGKELFAKKIHELSNRSGMFKAQNCGALTETLLESELFGHVKGAFTSAINDKKGLFEVAHNGTVFLDELGETPLNFQVKLLRVLEGKIITPVGSTKDIKVDVRIIAATNANLKELIEQKKFRSDLYFRLNEFSLTLPMLRDRPQDILPLAYFFLTVFTLTYNKVHIKGFSEGCQKAFLQHDWPGNVRELQSRVKAAVVLSSGSLISWANAFRDLVSPPNAINRADPRELPIMKKVFVGPRVIDYTKLTIELLDQLAEEGQPLTDIKLADKLGLGKKQGQRLYKKVTNALASIQGEILPSPYQL